MLLSLRWGLSSQFCLQNLGPVVQEINSRRLGSVRPYHVTNLCWIGQVIGVGVGSIRIDEEDNALDLELIEH